MALQAGLGPIEHSRVGTKAQHAGMVPHHHCALLRSHVCVAHRTTVRTVHHCPRWTWRTWVASCSRHWSITWTIVDCPLAAYHTSRWGIPAPPHGRGTRCKRLLAASTLNELPRWVGVGICAACAVALHLHTTDTGMAQPCPPAIAGIQPGRAASTCTRAHNAARGARLTHGRLCQPHKLCVRSPCDAHHNNHTSSHHSVSTNTNTSLGVSTPHSNFSPTWQPLSAPTCVRQFGAYLTEFEQSEVFDYRDVYYFGKVPIEMMCVRASPTPISHPGCQEDTWQHAQPHNQLWVRR